MTKFNRKDPTARTTQAPMGISTRTTINHEGAAAFALDTRTELNNLATTTFWGADTFYEKGDARCDRFRALVRRAALEDFEWLSGMLGWLRLGGNLRTIALVGACEAVHERLAAGLHGGNRQLINSVCQRADEPAEVIAYWGHLIERATNRKVAPTKIRLPMPVKRGLADAVKRLYTEYSFAKYDRRDNPIRFADVIKLTHPKATTPEEAALWAHAYTVRRNRDDITIPDCLPLLNKRAEVGAVPVEERRPMILTEEGRYLLKDAGYTWSSYAAWLQGPLDKDAWEAIVGNMPYTAKLRNLRNFERAGIGNNAVDEVCRYLSSEKAVEKSRVMPFQYLTAYLNTESLLWARALEQALTHSVRNIPDLPGRTLVMVDTSASMRSYLVNLNDDPRLPRNRAKWKLSEAKRPSCVMAAAVFGVATALKCEDVDLVGWASGQFTFPVPKGMGLLRGANDFVEQVGSVGHGTELALNLAAAYKGHDRVFIFSDFQAFPQRVSHSPWGDFSLDDIRQDKIVPASVPVYAFDLSGYGSTVVPTGLRNRHQMAGLTDDAFGMVKALEAGEAARWPWESKEA